MSEPGRTPSEDVPVSSPSSDDPGVWATPIDRHRRRRLRMIGTIIGALLVGAAAVVVITRGGELSSALAALSRPSPTAIAALAAAIVGSTVLSTIVLLVLIRRFGEVGAWEMLHLVCTSTLGNFIPLQPGLAGRVAYHHMVNHIPVRKTVLSLIEASLVSAVSVGLLIAALALQRRSGDSWPWWTPMLAGVVALPLLASPGLRPFALALLARWVEVLLWALRAWACFALVGEEITPRAALAFGCVAVSANLVPFIGNGLGIREWAIGLLATPLAGVPMQSGLAAELVGRAAELIFFVPAGLAAGPGVMRRVRAALQTRTQ